MPLNPVALLAMEGPEVVAGVAGLYGRQPHRRTASGALRSFVLRVEHGLLSCTGRGAAVEAPSVRSGLKRYPLGAVALHAVKGAEIEPRFGRSDPGEHHGGFAPRAGKRL